MSRLGFLLIFFVVQASTAHAQTAWLNASQFGAICDGRSHPLSQKFSTLGAAQAAYPFVTSLNQEIDYAALKLASNTALGADGAEHGSSNPQANIPLYIPQGVCYLGNDTWTIRAASGIRIEGAAATATTIEGNGIVLAFDGLWYSQIGNLGITSLSSAATVALDIDGNVPGHLYNTFGVQANSFVNLLVNSGGSKYGVALCRQGGGAGQCSEDTFINFHGQNASEAVYYQNGFNAIDNVIVGGDIQNYTKNAVELIAGSVKILGMSFESTTGYTQIANGGCDIQASAAGTEESVVAYGSRTESLCFYNGAWSQVADLRGIRQSPGAFVGWTATTSYPLNTVTSRNGTDGLPHMYRVTTAGTSGGVEPTWVASGTVADGSIVWTMTTYNAVNIWEGSFDTATSYLDPTASYVAGWEPAAVNCGSSPSMVANSTRYNGAVTEGSGATGCIITIRFPQSVTQAPQCIVTSPSGAALTSYSVTYSGTAFPLDGWVLTIANPPTAKDGSNKFSWICRQ